MIARIPRSRTLSPLFQPHPAGICLDRHGLVQVFKIIRHTHVPIKEPPIFVPPQVDSITLKLRSSLMFKFHYSNYPSRLSFPLPLHGGNRGHLQVRRLSRGNHVHQFRGFRCKKIRLAKCFHPVSPFLSDLSSTHCFLNRLACFTYLYSDICLFPSTVCHLLLRPSCSG
jgi:hypothetical protein